MSSPAISLPPLVPPQTPHRSDWLVAEFWRVQRLCKLTLQSDHPHARHEVDDLLRVGRAILRDLEAMGAAERVRR